MTAVDQEEYVERVLTVAEQIPVGRVTTYGAIADAVGVGGPRQVGRVMSMYGGSVPWWRVVRADGGLPLGNDDVARAHHLEEGTAFRPSGRVDLRAAMWVPGPSEQTMGGPPDSVGGF